MDYSFDGLFGFVIFIVSVIIALVSGLNKRAQNRSAGNAAGQARGSSGHVPPQVPPHTAPPPVPFLYDSAEEGKSFMEATPPETPVTQNESGKSRRNLPMPGIRDLRSAIIWGEVLRRKF